MIKKNGELQQAEEYNAIDMLNNPLTPSNNNGELESSIPPQ
jgi:hypothetical protein